MYMLQMLTFVTELDYWCSQDGSGLGYKIGAGRENVWEKERELFEVW